MFEGLPDGYNFRAWIPGCSTGEEAYSLAIVFKETLQKLKNPKNISFQIFATDLDQDAIDQARRAYYPANIIADVESDRLNRFFVETKNGYRINADIREMVVFASQNVIKDPPFTKIDFLSCRNMLIYMEADLQMKLLSMFQYCLNPGGLLLLGSAETIGTQSTSFLPVEPRLRICKLSPDAKYSGQIDFPSSFSRINPDVSGKTKPVKITPNIQVLADQLLLQQFAPASVMINAKGDIIYITGRTGKYLEPAAGKVNMNIFAMAREGLKSELPVAFRKSMQTYERVVLNNIMIGTNGGSQLVDVVIQKIDKPESLNGMFMVIFYDVPGHFEGISKKAEHKKTDADSGPNILEAELMRTKEDLQLTIEEMQTSQEELKSANEELQSTNEELQSTNEELSTSKEEMQSLNEELQTVNAELQSRIDDYIHVNNDFKNLLDSTDIATLFLDKELNIRRFTKSVAGIIKLIESDTGRPFTDIVTDLDYPEIAEDAREVLRTLVYVEKNIVTRDGRWFMIRIMPYRTIDDRIDGLVITFTDITKSKILEIALRESGRKMFHSIMKSIPFVIVSLSSECKIIEFNSAAENLFRRKYKDVAGKSYVELFIPEPERLKVESDLKRMFVDPLMINSENIVKDCYNNDHIIEWSVYNLSDNKMLIGFVNIHNSNL